MPRMSKKRKHELSFYLNDRGRVTYNELCRKCKHGCKQSFRAVVVDCPRYLYNPFIIIDGIGYKCKYEPCEALNHYANELMTREP